MKVQATIYETGMTFLISLEEAVRRLSIYYAYPMEALLRGIPVTTPVAEYSLTKIKSK